VVPDAGLSGGARALRRRGGGRRRQRDPDEPDSLRRRRRAARARRPCLRHLRGAAAPGGARLTFAPAPYIEWAKKRPRPGIDLAGSSLLACRLEDLPGAREAVELAGESPEGYPPLREAIARRYGVTPARVATAIGCSGANFLALSALLEPGDDVVMETPYYDPIPAAARMAGASVRTFERRMADGFDVDPDAVEP